MIHIHELLRFVEEMKMIDDSIYAKVADVLEKDGIINSNYTINAGTPGVSEENGTLNVSFHMAFVRKDMEASNHMTTVVSYNIYAFDVFVEVMVHDKDETVVVKCEKHFKEVGEPGSLSSFTMFLMSRGIETFGGAMNA